MSSPLLRTLVVGTEVVIVWLDGHESYFPGEALRKACPCAACRGEQHLFGRASVPVPKPFRVGACQPIAVRPVGNYGLSVTWGDGHAHGIYDLAELRRACPCPICSSTYTTLA